MTNEQLITEAEKLKAMGYEITGFHVGFRPGFYPPVDPDKKQATNATLLWVLNQLKAAPGQPNRELIRKYLFFRKFIGPASLPEEWDLKYVPTKKSELAILAGEIARFETDNSKPIVTHENSGNAPQHGQAQGGIQEP